MADFDDLTAEPSPQDIDEEFGDVPDDDENPGGRLASC